MPGIKGRSGGRNAKTVKQHQREGTFDPSRHGGVRNPEPPVGPPAAVPTMLKGEALAEWHRMIDRLAAAQTLSTIDDAVLYGYCRLHADTERLQAAVDALPSMYYLRHTLAGYDAKIHPVVVQLRQYRMALRTYLVEFGLTPASRGRVRMTDSSAKGDDNKEPTSRLGQLQKTARILRIAR